jgi:hypothetical protein
MVRRNALRWYRWLRSVWDRSRIWQRFQSFGEQRSGSLFPARPMRPFVSLSCSREDNRLVSGAQGPCSQHAQ